VLYIFTTSFADNHGHTRAPVPLFLLPFRTFPDIFSSSFATPSPPSFPLKFELHRGSQHAPTRLLVLAPMSAASGLFADEECENLLAGLDGGSDHLSGSEDSAGHGEHDDYDDDGFAELYEDEGPLKKTKPLLPWSHEEIVLGWMAVATILHFHAEDGCDGAAIVCRGGYITAHEVLYRFQCAFANRLLCEWQLEVRIPFDQKAAARQYQRLHPDCDDAAFDAIQHNHQTMAVAPLAARSLVHARHVCFVKTANPHTRHHAYQPKGAHCLWVAHCMKHPYALHSNRAEIQQWLVSKKIDCEHAGTDSRGHAVRTCQLIQMAQKCKRFNEHHLCTHNSDGEIKTGYEGKLLALCNRYALGATAEFHGPTGFTLHTSYIIAGWSASSAADQESGGLCVLITTFNLALNFARALKWYNGRVTLAIDHTHKVLSPFLFLLRLPDLPVSVLTRPRSAR
jgi:hypothetical protein